MRRIVSLALSLALVLSLCVGFFSFSSAAGTADPDTANFDAMKPASSFFYKADADSEEVTVNANTVTSLPDGGTLSFDVATGTITLDNASFYYLCCNTGALTIKLVGTNMLTGSHGTDYAIRGAQGLKFVGDGTLVLNAPASAQYVINCNGGDLIFAENVKIISTVAYAAEVLHNGGGASPVSGVSNHHMVFKDNATIDLSTSAANATNTIRSQAIYGAIIIKDKANITVTQTKQKSWGSAIKAANGAGIEIRGGTVNLDVTGTAAATTGINVEATSKGASGYLSMTGGTVNATLTNATASARTAVFFAKNAPSLELIGGKIDAAINNTNSQGSDGGLVMGQSSEGSDNLITLSADITFNGTNSGLISAACAAAITGGSVKGTCSQLLVNGNCSLLGGSIDLTFTDKLVKAGTIGQAYIDFNSAAKSLKGSVDSLYDYGSPIVVTDGNGTHVVNGFNAFNGGGGGSIAWDDMECAYVIQNLSADDGVTKVAVNGNVTFAVYGDNVVSTTGNNVFWANNSYDSGMTFCGTGSLSVTGGQWVFGAQGCGGNFTITDSVYVSVKATDGAGFQIAAGCRDSQIYVSKYAKLDVTAKGVAIDLVNAKGELCITDNAIVNATSTGGDAIQFRPGDSMDSRSFEDGLISATVRVIDKAKLTAVGGSCGIRMNVPATDTGLHSSKCAIILGDEAIVDIKAPGQTIYMIQSSNALTPSTISLSGIAKLVAENTGNYAVLQNNNKPLEISVIEDALFELKNNANGNTYVPNGGFKLVDGTILRKGTDPATAAMDTAYAAANVAYIAFGQPASVEEAVYADVEKDGGDDYLTAETFKSFDFQGVQIRRTAPTGLRFLATISDHLINFIGEDKIAGVGFILALETAYTGELVYDGSKTGSISAGGIVKAPCTTFWTEDDDFGYEIFTVVISGLDNNLETRISARPYIELTTGELIYLDLSETVAVNDATYANGTYTTCVSDVAKYLVSISDEQQKSTYSKFIAEDPE